MIVVDTNIIAYLLIPSDLTQYATEVRRQDPNWLAPELWRSEFRNVLMLYIRRELLNLDKAEVVIKTAESLVETYPVDSPAVLKLAADSGCTAYDCEFVYLARSLNIPLVTSDKKVLNAFPNISVSMENFTVK